MDLKWFEDITDKERGEFSRICNMLLSQTYIIREDREGRVSREYVFIERNFSHFEDYLSLSGWKISRDSQYGVICVRNAEGYNKLTLDKLSTILLAVMRIIYEEARLKASATNEVITTTGEILSKTVNEFSMYARRPPLEDVKTSMRIFEQHCIIRRLDENYKEMDCRIMILPSIIFAVPNERCRAVCDALKTETETSDDEETYEAEIDQLALLQE